jgi:hypothetical protein
MSMNMSNSNSSVNVTSILWWLLLGLAAIGLIVGSSIYGYSFAIAVIFGISLGVVMAYQFPLFTVFLSLVTGVLPLVFLMTPIYSVNWGALGGGLNAVDLVMVLMGGAVVLKLVFSGRRIGGLGLRGLSTYTTILSLWFIFEILRNLGVYGISAPGEFRYRYLVLVIPLYVGLFFPTAGERRRLFHLLIFFSIGITLVNVPIIGTLKGWVIRISGTSESRFLPSDLTLGLVYGLTTVFLARKHRFIELSNRTFWLIASLVVFMVYIDGHRSVWLAGSAILFGLMAMKEIKATRIWHWGIPLLIVVISVWFASEQMGLNPTEYIAARGIAFVSPEEDQTSAWRLGLWEVQMTKFYNSPVAGEGFGGHFGLTGLKGDIGISPHSLYVQTLVKIGVIGILLYLTIVVKLLSAFGRWIRIQTKRGNPEVGLVEAVFFILIAAHVYYLTYAFEYYTWLFVGLGIAVIRSTPNGDYKRE